MKKNLGLPTGKPATRRAPVTSDAGGSEETGECAEQPSTSGVESTANTGDPGGGYARAMKDVRLNENLQVRCNSINRFRYVAGSEDYFCRPGCIQRARSVSYYSIPNFSISNVFPSFLVSAKNNGNKKPTFCQFTRALDVGQCQHGSSQDYG